jgi:hypothetical protein
VLPRGVERHSVDLYKAGGARLTNAIIYQARLLIIWGGGTTGHLFQGGQSTKVTYVIWYPNMVALGAISSKLSLTPRESPVRCVRSGMLSDFDS